MNDNLCDSLPEDMAERRAFIEYEVRARYPAKWNETAPAEEWPGPIGRVDPLREDDFARTGFLRKDLPRFCILLRNWCPPSGRISRVAHYRLRIAEAELKAEALEWATTRGARSGRVAWQFVQDLAGRLGVVLSD